MTNDDFAMLLSSERSADGDVYGGDKTRPFLHVEAGVSSDDPRFHSLRKNSRSISEQMGD